MNYVESFNLFGVEAKEIPCIKGDGAPTKSTIGAVGIIYMNTTNGETYKCIDVYGDTYIWKKDACIDDDNVGLNTWSSQKIYDEISKIAQSGIIQATVE